MTTSSPSQQYLKKLAGANQNSVRMIRKQLSTPLEMEETAKAQTVSSSGSPKQSQISQSKFETWQDLWIRDHKPETDLDKQATQTIIFHSSIPAIMIELNKTVWDLPRNKHNDAQDVVVSGELFGAKVLSKKESEVPINIDKSKLAWAIIGEETSWGYEYSREVREVLNSIARHNDVPAWTSVWSLVQSNDLASVIAFAGITHIYQNYESAQGEQGTEDVIMLVAESGGDSQETVVLEYGTKAPSTHVPIALAGRTSK